MKLFVIVGLIALFFCGSVWLSSQFGHSTEHRDHEFIDGELVSYRVVFVEPTLGDSIAIAIIMTLVSIGIMVAIMNFIYRQMDRR